MNNRIELMFYSLPENEALARMTISAFLVRINPTLSFLSEVRTAVSEAVTNAVVHAYPAQSEGKIVLRAAINEQQIDVEIEDYGCGISDIAQAMQPFFTTQPQQERSGMGFSLMQSFMDGVTVESTAGKGTRVKMKKLLGGDEHDIL